MSIKFKILYKDQSTRFVEYIFDNFKSHDFDMVHYDGGNNLITRRPAFNYKIKKVLRNLVRNASENNAIVRIVERNSK